MKISMSVRDSIKTLAVEKGYKGKKKIQNRLTELLLSNVFVNFSALTSSSLTVSSGVPWTCWPMNRAPGSSSIPWKEAMPSAS